MAWRVAKSLDKLLAQVNAAAPNRSKISDGSIGDAAHATTDSDHNPHVKDGTMGVVTARDFTHDPDHGADMHDITEAIRLSKDPRLKYAIWNHLMFSSYPSAGKPPFTWRAYSGSNPHTHHAHVSVHPDKSLYDSTKPWSVALKTPRKWHLRATKDGQVKTKVYDSWAKAKDWIRNRAKDGWRVVTSKK